MDQLFADCLAHMESWFEKLEMQVPPPVKIRFLDHFVFRYKEKSVNQMLIQKLARVVTGLHSARILLNNGFMQEQIAIHRMLDEFQEDITFFFYAYFNNNITNLHQRYLDAFYEEEFDVPENPVASVQKRPSIPRKNIHAYIARQDAEISGSDPNRVKELMRTLSKTYSGFVHGASPQIMDMYGGLPPKYYIAGMLGTTREQEHRSDLWNYFFRGLLSFEQVAMVFNDANLLKHIEIYKVAFAKKIGKNYGS